RCYRDWSSDVCSSDLVGFLQGLRFVQHDQKLVTGIVRRQDRGKGGQDALSSIAAVDDLFGGAGLAADVIAFDVGLPRRADLGIEDRKSVVEGMGVDSV